MSHHDEEPARESPAPEGEDGFEIRPWHESDLLSELHAVRAIPAPQSRGYKLEALLERAFQRAHFEAPHNPRMAGRRQTDFAVISHNSRYLVEAKWENHQAGTDIIQAIRARLRRVDGTVVGILFTMLGINAEAEKEIADFRQEGLILVFDETDIVLALREPQELERMLRLKHDQLVVHGNVHYGEKASQTEKAARRSRKQLRPLPESAYRLLTASGEDVTWFQGDGGFDSTVFCLDLPDIDWVPAAGSGVSLDMPVGAWDQRELLRLLQSLDELGWIGRKGQWSIQQHRRNWHGTGARSFAEALTGWKERTDELEDPHHSEEFVYFEACDGGFFTMSGNVSAERTRRVSRCNVSFQLVGMPLDPGSLQQLYRRFDVPSRGYFRPLVERAVTRQRVAGGVPLEVLGYIVEPADRRWDNEDWVVGILAANPYGPGGSPAPEELPGYPVHSGVVACALRSHHPLSKTKERYELWSYERARTSDATALCIVAEWWDAEDSIERRPTATAGYFGVQYVDLAPGRARVQTTLADRGRS
ncbi:hypothetical protein [Streptomyces sp. NPDC002535]